MTFLLIGKGIIAKQKSKFVRKAFVSEAKNEAYNYRPITASVGPPCEGAL